MLDPRRLLLIGCAFLAAAGGVAAAETVYLEADFNDKPVNRPIETGGPTVGEPIAVDTGIITAIVREGPMGSQSLEIGDDDVFSAGYVEFGFLGDAELTAGIVVIAADLWFPPLGEGRSYSVIVREQAGAADNFASLIFGAAGEIQLGDAAGYPGVIASYQPERTTRLILEYDMDSGTYDIWVDGVRVVDDRSHGITESGVGSLYFGCVHDPDTEGYFFVDAISVSDTFHEVATSRGSWGSLKGAFHR